MVFLPPGARLFNGFPIISLHIISTKVEKNLVKTTFFSYSVDPNLKNIIQITINKAQERKIWRVTSKESTIPNVTLKIQTKKGNVIASLDREISDEELDLYIKALMQAANSVDDSDNYNFIYKVIEKNSDGSFFIFSFK